MHLGPPTPPSNVRVVLQQRGGLVTARERWAGQPVLLAGVDAYTFEGRVEDLPTRGWLTVVVDDREHQVPIVARDGQAHVDPLTPCRDDVAAR